MLSRHADERRPAPKTPKTTTVRTARPDGVRRVLLASPDVWIHHMTGKPRTTFAKLQRERARQAKQAAKRARRQGTPDELGPMPREATTLPPADGAATPPTEDTRADVGE